MRHWIVDASPIIILGSVGRLDLLTALCPDLVIPAAVAAEICDPSRDDAAKAWIEGFAGRYVCNVGVVEGIVAGWDLGVGETEVLSAALRATGSEAILDDLAARKCAAALGIRVKGTLGIVVLAKREGLIPLAAPLIEELRRAGLRMHPGIMAKALELAGEAPALG